MDGIVSDPSNPFIHSLGDETRMEAGNGWRPTPAVTSSHFSQINGQRTLVNRWSVKSMSGRSDSALALLYSRIGSAATNYRTSPRPKPRYQLSSCLPRPRIIICCRGIKLKESPNCLSISMEVLVFQHLIPHATLDDMTRTPVPEAKVQYKQKRPLEYREKGLPAQPQPS